MPGTLPVRLFVAAAVAIAVLAAMPLLGPQGARHAEAGTCNKLAFPNTLQSLIDGGRSGDVICMVAGVYRGPVTFQGKSGITLRGQGPRQTIIAGGTRDGMLVFNSKNLTFEDFTLYVGNPSNAYVWRSQNVVFRRIDVGGGTLGIHYDGNSIGTIEDSFVYAIQGDGVLTRNKSNVTVQRNWIFNNRGVGVSTVGETANTVVTRNIISHNDGPGVFAGQTPCALLPPGFVEVPDCYLDNLRAYVGDANVILDSNVIQASGSTGIVMFPGTRGTFRNNHIWRNELSGLFVWGATISSENDEYDRNEEHAIELRAYPDPLKYPEIAVDQRIRAVGSINNNDIHDSVVLPETGTLGGGVLAQGANVDVTNSRIYGNRGIGVSYVNTSLGRIVNNRIYDNRGSGICLFRAGNVTTSGNVLTGNVNNSVGVCHETTP
ncbi:MAG: right-handed parallel beta-helix repeat-containing protein [Dehalococcoidia bacterium]